MTESYFMILLLHSGDEMNIQICISYSQSMYNFMFNKEVCNFFSVNTLSDGFQWDDVLPNILLKSQDLYAAST